jgi:hypothetical protein
VIANSLEKFLINYLLKYPYELPRPSLDKEKDEFSLWGWMAMAKRNRGKALEKLPSRGRGDCPLCDRNRIKLLYIHKTEAKEIIKVCKNCRDRKY